MENAVTLQAAADIILTNIITMDTSIIKKATNEAPAFLVQEVPTVFSVANDSSILYRKEI